MPTEDIGLEADREHRDDRERARPSQLANRLHDGRKFNLGKQPAEEGEAGEENADREYPHATTSVDWRVWRTQASVSARPSRNPTVGENPSSALARSEVVTERLMSPRRSGA